MQYRKEIDGLRAIAVLPVLLFHAKVPGFGGGYVGVDIFFVISGYLITGILLEDLRQDRFSILTFYERRARRILPALFAMTAATAVGAYALMAPDQFRDFGQSLIALAIFGSNILFWWESGYFEASAEEKPLLHTWSLSVEEQFYIFFPALLYLIWRISRRDRAMLTMLGTLVLASLAFSQWQSAVAPTANFYLLPSRVWELVIGSIAMIIATPRIAAPWRAALGWAGIGALAVAITCYSESTPFPSAFALLPVLGTALVLVFADQENAPGRLLGNPLFVGIGLISYSLYLWHQPLLAFYRIKAGVEASVTGMVVAIALSVPLAYLSWRFVEGPFRKPARKGGYSQRAIFTMSLTGIAAMMLLGGGIIKNVVQLPYQIPSKVTASFARLDPASNCFDVAEAHNSDKSFCSIGDTKRAPDFLLLGDSHGLSLKQAFDDAGRQTGRAGLFIGYSGCPPLLDLVPDRNDQERHDCAALTRFAFNTAATRGLRDVVLVARWDYYIGSDGHTANGTLQYLGERGGSPATSLDQNRRILADAMARTVEFARRRGLTLHVIEQVPHQNHGPQSVYYAAARGGARLVEEQSLSRADYLAQIAPARRLFMPFTNGPAASVRYHADIDTLCKASLCPVGTPEHSYYFDDDHLSLIGAARLRPMAERALRAP